ncbi:epimerase [Cylindrospermopsis raciborskii CENA303]|uniref:Epimerase n=1 Tax=Cylindrospermopsis raciborskii CENA303 TaxID=1170769 RepID=A0A1X4G4I0_9CYAN|nr:TIGR01777 family oxidoreductase [Cylindrospermopsis raciborskii]EFA72101.1 conserved hypothetical protein [Raphidiopsis brookii D9]OSO89431.1 epimerase [Cylindrospermopsis raciborskii CENA303]
MKVAVTGATGFVGSRLVQCLHDRGEKILVLSRNPTRSAARIFPSEVFPNVEILAYTPGVSGVWQSRIAGCDGVVNLAGEPITQQRWTPEHKLDILNSRKLGTQKIVEAIAEAKPKPSVLINASAIGFYGTSQTATFDENSPTGKDFLAQVCQQWEEQAQMVRNYDVRLVILRFGIVLGNGGALGKMITPFKLFAGGPIGSGNQWFSWIHLNDIVNLIIQSLVDPNAQGVYNATAPHPVQMKDLSNTMAQVMNRPAWLPVPGFALEALLGEGAMVVLEGQRVLPQRTQALGFEYQYPLLSSALREILT